MNSTSEPRISQILPNVTCSDCGLPVELRKLGEHVCSSAPPLPPLKAFSAPASDNGTDSQEKLSLPFLEKYSKMTGKAMNSLRTAAAAAPSISEGLYRTISSKTPAQSNGSTNERKQTFDAPTNNTSPRDPIPDPLPKNTPSYERRPSINTDVASKSSTTPRRKNSDDEYFSPHSRFFNESTNIDPILEDEDRYLPSQPTFSRSTTTDKYDDYSSRRPSNATRSKKPFFLGNLSQENIHSSGKNSFSSPHRQSEDEDYYPYEEGRRSPYRRQVNSPSRSSSSDEVNSPKTPGSYSYKEDFGNARYNNFQTDSRTDMKAPMKKLPPKKRQDTEDLDSLMADLMKDVSEDFDHAPMPAPIARPVAPKPRELMICTICQTAINRRELIYDRDQKTCHRYCLSCIVCQEELGDDIDYYTKDGNIYCERDYNALRRRVMCAACDRPIASIEQSIKALGGEYHIGHLKCYHCKQSVDKETTGIVEHKGRVYCKRDFQDLYLPKCTACRRPVEREAVSAADGKLKGKWHRECFGCHTCRRPFPNNTFYVFDSLPYCKRHYHRLNNSLCRHCDEPIEGPCAQTAEGWRFHPPCFTCQACHCSITDVYYMLDNQIFCERDIGHIQRKKNMRAEKRRTQFGRV